MMQRNDYRRRRLVLRERERRPPTVEAERVREDRDSKPVTPPPTPKAFNADGTPVGAGVPGAGVAGVPGRVTSPPYVFLAWLNNCL